MIGVIDYDAGNIMSVVKALESLGQEVVVTRDADKIMSCDRVILPGVGSFGDAMNKLGEYDLIKVIKDYAATGKPFLGICLGLQLMFEESEESPGVEGLGLLEGKIKYIDAKGLKIPHMGWNSLEFPKKSRLFAGIPKDSFVYFVHSYYLVAKNLSDVAATCEYGVHIHAAVEHGNICATQFHPEKSSEVGLKILENFTKME